MLRTDSIGTLIGTLHRTLAPLLGPIGGGFSALGLVATAPSPSAIAGSAASSSARTTSLLPNRLGAEAKLTRPLLTPLVVGTPAASMNREVADAMFVLAMELCATRRWRSASSDGESEEEVYETKGRNGLKLHGQRIIPSQRPWRPG
jgi:hypothetical protein